MAQNLEVAKHWRQRHATNYVPVGMREDGSGGKGGGG